MFADLALGEGDDVRGAPGASDHYHGNPAPQRVQHVHDHAEAALQNQQDHRDAQAVHARVRDALLQFGPAVGGGRGSGETNDRSKWTITAWWTLR